MNKPAVCTHIQTGNGLDVIATGGKVVGLWHHETDTWIPLCDPLAVAEVIIKEEGRRFAKETQGVPVHAPEA